MNQIKPEARATGQHWITVELSEIVNILDGLREPLNSDQRASRKGPYPYYGANGQVDSIDSYRYDGDHILIAEDGGYFDEPSRGVAYKASGKFWVNNHAHVVQPLGDIPIDYLIHVLNTVNWMNYVSGTTRLKLTQSSLKTVRVPLPPLNEQRRIVTKIEALMERSRRAKAALDAIPPLLEQFRQSVLAAAFRDDLTADWREQNHCSEWKQIMLAEVIKFKPRNGYSPEPVNFPTKTKSLTLSATTSGKFKPEHFKYINEQIPKDSHLWLLPGDILIQRGNTIELVGVSAVFDKEPETFIYPDLMMKIQVREEISTPDFIYYALSTERTREYFRKNATGTAGNMPKINQRVVSETPLMLPDLQEQIVIVQRIQNLFQISDRLIAKLQIERKYLNTLNQSILAQAFRGELVPQDPNDEPASVLLGRIQEERRKAEAAGGRKSGGKRRERGQSSEQLSFAPETADGP